MLAFDAAICYYNGTKKLKGEIQMEKKLYEFTYENDVGEKFTVNVRLSKSEINLLNWLKEQFVIGEFELNEIEEVKVLEF